MLSNQYMINYKIVLNPLKDPIANDTNAINIPIFKYFETFAAVFTSWFLIIKNAEYTNIITAMAIIAK